MIKKHQPLRRFPDYKSSIVRSPENELLSINVSNSEADIYRKAFAKNKFYKKKDFRDRLEFVQRNMSVDDIDLIKL